MDPGKFTPWLGVSDPIAAGTHLFGAIASVGAGVQLWRRTSDDPWRRFSVCVFAGSMVLLFAASTAYHSVAPGPLKERLRHCDHAAIYVLIAGTFTPIAGNLLRGWFRGFVLGTVWLAAVAGVTLKLFFFAVAARFEWLDVSLYLAMGWFGVVPFVQIFREHRAWRAAFLIISPALAYSLGAICEYYGWPVIIEHVFGHHEVFHICVLIASGLFYKFVLDYVTPLRKKTSRGPAEDPRLDQGELKTVSESLRSRNGE